MDAMRIMLAKSKRDEDHSESGSTEGSTTVGE